MSRTVHITKSLTAEDKSNLLDLQFYVVARNARLLKLVFDVKMELLYSDRKEARPHDIICWIGHQKIKKDAWDDTLNTHMHRLLDLCDEFSVFDPRKITAVFDAHNRKLRIISDRSFEMHSWKHGYRTYNGYSVKF